VKKKVAKICTSRGASVHWIRLFPRQTKKSKKKNEKVRGKGGKNSKENPCCFINSFRNKSPCTLFEQGSSCKLGFRLKGHFTLLTVENYFSPSLMCNHSRGGSNAYNWHKSGVTGQLCGEKNPDEVGSAGKEETR